MKKLYSFSIIRWVFLFGTILWLSPDLQAQSTPQFTQFFFNKLLYNPGYAGSKEVLSVSGQYRYQWAGLDGAPKTANLTAHLPFFHNRCGLGISVTNDKIALISSNYLTLSYAYRIPFKKKRSTLALGIQGSFKQDRFNWQNAEVADFQDDIIPFGTSGGANGNFGLGAYYSSRSFYVGISMPKFFDDAGLKALLNLANTKTVRSYFFMSGISLPLNDKLVLKPAVLFTYNPNIPPIADINISLLIMDMFWIGATYRSSDSVDAILQYKLNKRWRMGVSYDFTTSHLSAHTNGTAEIIVEYLFDNDKNKLKNLRFFD